MPSILELGQFKSSFDNIANERDNAEALKIPFDNFPLPEKDAPPFNFNRDDLVFDPNKPSNNQSDISDIIPDSTPESSSDVDSFDFSSFMSDLSGDDNLPTMDDTPLDDTPPDGAADSAASALDDFLNDLSSPPAQEEPDSDFSQWTDDGINNDEGSPLESSPIDNSPIEGFDSFDTPSDSAPAGFNLDDFGFDGQEQEQEQDQEQMPEQPPAYDTDNTDDFDDMGIDMGGESLEGGSFGEQAASDDVTDDFSDFGFPDTGSEPAAEDTPPDDFGSDDFGSDDFGGDETGIDMGGESADFEQAGTDDTESDFSADSSLPDEGFPGMDDFGSDFGTDFDTGSQDDSSSFGTGGGDTDFAPDTSSEGFESEGPPLDLSDFGSDFESSSIDLDNTFEAAPEGDDYSDSSFSSDTFGDDDFSLSGIDDILNKSKVPSLNIPVPKKKKGLFGRKKDKDDDLPEPEDSIEEISLTQDDVNSLLRTLSFYPLNLRIICQELIAEQVIQPQHLSKLIRLLVHGAHVKETAALVEEITGKPVVIPKSFEKMTGAAFEAEQSSFAYIFVHNFLPVLRLFAVIAALLASIFYLSYTFIYIPMRAESIYKRGYERIAEGEYQRANDLFQQAFSLHRKKKWFYLYAEAFRDQRRFTLAEGKYDELLRHYPRDKKGVLDYASLNTHYLLNYEKANRLLQRELLDYAPNDKEGLLAAGDNFMAWADSNPSRFFDRYEDARFSYARYLELYGWQPHIVERMMMYFIRVDDLRRVIELRRWFESTERRRLSPESLSELGGYLLDKQLETPVGVPDPYIDSIESVRDMLLRAMLENPVLPEPHYHLARYHHSLGNTYDERLTLENAIRAFDLARQESVRRRLQRVDTHYRYANLLINAGETFPAEEQVVRGINLFRDFYDRNLIAASPQLGQLYALRGDLEYFVKSGNMEAALSNYHDAERFGYSPPEVQYRMGAAYYQLERWGESLEYLFKAAAELPLNRRLLYALGNVTYQRGDYFAAQGYYNRLLDVLEGHRVRLNVLLPNDNPQFIDTGERLMMARNNLGVVYEYLADQTGNREYRNRAMTMYIYSSSAWDSITRNPQSMTRSRLADSPGAPGINLGYLNANNALRPNNFFDPQVFVRIDRDVLEPSRWEEITTRVREGD
ncbi:MAG: tetratricopeptide repeat protein [Treponema sp.]|nr:tetratricopeptide repeat protein [Treponema sp.]